MVTQVVIWEIPGHRRSHTLCHAMAQGIAKVGDKPVVMSSIRYTRPTTPVAFFYGAAGRLANAITDYAKAGGTAVYADLGYHGRQTGGRWEGYHKLVVNARHPTAYFQAVRHTDERARALGMTARPWQRGHFVMIAGMSQKGAAFEGLQFNEWEAKALAEIQRVCRRPVFYRPKPNDLAPRALAGAQLLNAQVPLLQALRGCHAVVSHHSNANVEALMGGCPSFTAEGAALPVSLSDLSRIETPRFEANRQQWLADLAWTQFSVAEMSEGVAWRHLKDEGLVP